MNQRSTYSWPRPDATTLVAVALIAFAFVLAVRATAGLDWPCEIDFFRDMGGAQAILDGYAGSDPAYFGEKNWFNPLQPAVFAALAALTGLPLPAAYARFGPFVNLLGPIGFYVMARQLMGRWAALAALGAYLFLGKADVPSWFQATYSPWAWPMDFAQGFFFLTVAAYLRARATRQWRWDVIAGILLGITFLAHTAPTLVFVTMLFLLTLGSIREEPGPALRRLFVIGVVSLLVASPFLGPLLWDYHLHVLNHGPSEHEPIGVGFVVRNLLTVRTALAAVGLVMLALTRRTFLAPIGNTDAPSGDGGRASVLAAMFVAALGLLGYGLLAQGLHHRNLLALPRVLPTYHFHLYVKAAESLFFGLGLVATATCLVSVRRASPARSAAAESRLAAGLGALIVAAHLPGYLGGVELNKFRADAEQIGAETGRIALYDWLRKEATPTDVFLTDMNVGIWAVCPADRKVIALNDQYSNIYVSYADRAADLNQLFATLRAGDRLAFNALAAKYHVSHVIVARQTSEAYRVPPERLEEERFKPVFTQSDYTVYQRQ